MYLCTGYFTDSFLGIHQACTQHLTKCQGRGTHWEFCSSHAQSPLSRLPSSGGGAVDQSPEEVEDALLKRELSGI